MIPLLDVLQSIPVLGFLPGVVLALVSLFPRTNIGLELASILMIFTGQAWNLAFSVYQSMRNVPPECGRPPRSISLRSARGIFGCRGLAPT